jgi:hypothetical protein
MTCLQKTTLAGLSCFLAATVLATPATLVYKCDFNSAQSLEDWKMEGPGVAEIDEGRLLIHSQWQGDLESVGDEVPLIEPGGEKYYPYIEQWVREREPELLPKYLLDEEVGGEKAGKFSGGHIQYWNRNPHPENFIIRIKFQAVSPFPLHMVTFCGRGVNGKDVLDPSLNPRFGIAAQYMWGDIRNYRISYWSGKRGTSNMRRAPGRKLTARESGDLPQYALDKEVHLEIVRWNGRVVFKCDGETLVDWTDDDPFDDGFFSLRLMAAAKGWYDDYEVYELHEDPFSYTGKGEAVNSRISAQRDIPGPGDVIDDEFIVVGVPAPKGRFYRDIINTHLGRPVYRFEADGDAKRAELTTCYATDLDEFSEEELEDLSSIANLYLNNDQGSNGDTITYEWYARFPGPLHKDTSGIFAQWHGRPDRTLVQTPEGELKNLPIKEYIGLREQMKFINERGNIGVDIETGEPNGWRNDGSSGGPIGAFKFQDGYMCLLVRNDPYACSNNRIRIKPKPGGVRPYHQIGNKSGAIVYERPIEEVPINIWMHFKVQIKYSTYSWDSDKALTLGAVKVWIDGEQVADWEGDIGKNDKKGPYFKFGIYVPGKDGLKVDCTGFEQLIEKQ